MLALQVPDAPATAPPGFVDVALTILGWIKWVGIIAGVAGIIVIAIMMMFGRRNRSQLAADGLSALPWIVGGFILIGLSATLADWMLSAGEAVTSIDGASNNFLPECTPGDAATFC